MISSAAIQLILTMNMRQDPLSWKTRNRMRFRHYSAYETLDDSFVNNLKVARDFQ